MLLDDLLMNLLGSVMFQSFHAEQVCVLSAYLLLYMHVMAYIGRASLAACLSSDKAPKLLAADVRPTAIIIYVGLKS